MLTFDELKTLWRAEDNSLEREIIAGRLKPCLHFRQPLRSPVWDQQHPVQDRFMPTRPETWAELIWPNGVPSLGPEDGELPAWHNDPAEVPVWEPLYLQLPEELLPLDCIFTVGSPNRDPHVPTEPNEKLKAEWFFLPSQVSMADVKERGFFPMEEVRRYEDTYRKKHVSARPVVPEEKSTLLNIIAGLLDLTRELRGQPTGNNESLGKKGDLDKCDAQIAAEVAHHLVHYPGMKVRNIKDKFRDSKHPEMRSANPLMPKEKTTLLNVIAGLLVVARKLRKDAPAGDEAFGNGPETDTIDAGIAAAVAKRLSDCPGMTMQAIEEKFREADDNVLLV